MSINGPKNIKDLRRFTRFDCNFLWSNGHTQNGFLNKNNCLAIYKFTKPCKLSQMPFGPVYAGLRDCYI